MPGLLGTSAPIGVDLNFILQVIVLVLLLVGFRYGRSKKAQSLSRHEILMRIMVLLNLIGVVAVMVPAFVAGFFSVVLPEPAKLGFPLIFVHALLGSIAVVVGVVLTFRKFGNVRLYMRATFAFWLVTVLVGILIYVRYWVLLPP